MSRGIPAAPHAQPVSSTTHYPFSLINKAFGERARGEEGCDGPRTLSTKRAVLKAIVTTRPSRRAEEMEHHLLRVEQLMKQVRRPCR